MFVPLLAATEAKLPFVVKQPPAEVLGATKKGRVSIIIPAYGRLKYLQLAVEAALEQTYADIEVVISQNPKPEGLDPDIEQWSTTQSLVNPKVKYYANAANLGISGNYQACLSRLTGEYTIIIGDDDVLLPNCVERFMEGIRRGADVVFCNRFLINEHGYRTFGEHVALENGQLLAPGMVTDAEKVAWLNLVLLSGAAIKTEKLLALGFRPENNLEDFALFVKLAAIGSKFYFIDELLVEFRVHSASATGSGSGTFHHLLKQIIPVPVSEANETIKYNFISGLMAPAVNLCLQENNMSLAKYLLASSYYPTTPKMRVVRCVQQAMMHTSPAFITTLLGYRSKLKKRKK